MANPSPDKNRREFLVATGGVVAAAALPSHRLWARPASVAKTPAPESVVKTLYGSLTDRQREAICFAWDHVDPKRGLLRTRVANNWHVTRPELSDDFYTDDQREMVRDIMRGVYSPEWLERVDRQLDDDGGGWHSSSIGIFGEPGRGKFELVMTGRHQTVRCDGDSADHVAFGGPIFYGHAADGFNEGPKHPGNVYWPQAVAANEVYQMLDAEQREAALVRTGMPREQAVAFRKPSAVPGIPVGQLSAAQKSHLQGVLKKLLEPYRAADRREAVKCLNAQGGLDACRLIYYAQGDLGGDRVWDNWRLEGPAFVWSFRGAPHVHVWVNVADSPEVKLNA